MCNYGDIDIFCMYIYAEIATSGVNNWAILRDWHGGVLTKLVIYYPILELASIFWYHWMCNIQEGTIHMLTYSYTERNQPQRINIWATPTFLVCLSPRVKCTQHPVWCRSLTFMLCSLYPVYLGCITNKAIRDGKYLAPPHASAWQRSPH